MKLSQIKIILVGILFFGGLFAHKFWLNDVFWYLKNSGILDSLPLFSSHSAKEQMIFLYRLISSVLSVPAALAIVYLYNGTNDMSEENCENFYRRFALLTAVNLFASLVYNLFADSSSYPVSFISKSEFFLTHVVFFGITGPVIEETVYRLVIFASLRRHFSFAVSAVFSSLVFSMTHFRYPFYFILIVFAWGIFWAYSYEITGKPYVPVILHSINNFVASGFYLLKVL